MITVRRAEIFDINWLMGECMDFSDSYPSSISLMGDVAYAEKFLKNIVVNHLVYIAEVDGKPAGFIAGLIAPHHFNPDIMQLSELLWWVQEEHRSGGVGGALLRAFIDYGKLYCDFICLTVEATTPISDEKLSGMGFKLFEKAFLMECK